jgi:hypothetical protein
VPADVQQQRQAAAGDGSSVDNRQQCSQQLLGQLLGPDGTKPTQLLQDLQLLLLPATSLTVLLLLLKIGRLLRLLLVWKLLQLHTSITLHLCRLLHLRWYDACDS